MPFLCHSVTDLMGFRSQSLKGNQRRCREACRSPPPLRPARNCRQPHAPRPTAREVSPIRVQPQRVRTQPHGNSYFLPGKIAGKAATFLLDSGCTTNLISCQLFNTLSAKVRSELEPYDGEYGTLADRWCIPFYGIIELTGPGYPGDVHRQSA